MTTLFQHCFGKVKIKIGRIPSLMNSIREEDGKAGYTNYAVEEEQGLLFFLGELFCSTGAVSQWNAMQSSCTAISSMKNNMKRHSILSRSVYLALYLLRCDSIIFNALSCLLCHGTLCPVKMDHCKMSGVTEQYQCFPW